MPSPNVVKDYRDDSYYHVYNRGVEKRKIFITKKDQLVFERYLQEASDKYGLFLIKYVLMPNHFHLIIKQTNSRDIERLMRSLGTRYTLYFNFKYERVGSLFQGVYRGRLLQSEKELLLVHEYLLKNECSLNNPL